MSDHIPDVTKMVCPHCGAATATKEDGSPCRNHGGSWVAFECLTSIHAGHNARACQSIPCEKAERERLTLELTTLRTANAALVERVKRLEGAITAGIALMRATDPFTLTPDCENDDGVSLRQMHADSRVNWDEPPTACEHIALHDAVLAFGRAVAEAKATP